MITFKKESISDFKPKNLQGVFRINDNEIILDDTKLTDEELNQVRILIKKLCFKEI